MDNKVDSTFVVTEIGADIHISDIHIQEKQ